MPSVEDSSLMGYGKGAKLSGAAETDAGVIIPLLASVVAKFFDDSSMGSKMRSVTDMVCQLSDAEAESKMFQDSVYFCFVEDIVAATLICGESEQSITCPKSLVEYAHTREDFPSTNCMVANSTLHTGTIPNVVNFSDDDLILPLLMVDLLRSSNEKMLPRFIPTKVSVQESLTYLLLYRSCIIAASYSRQPYLCGADKVNAPVLVPGWQLPLVLTLMPEGDPIFTAKDLKNDGVPLVFISQSNVSPCSFLITVRGTATMFEWIQDFEYWQTPFFANPKVKTHVGFTRILSSVLAALEDFLVAQSERNQCSCRNTHLFFTGHSLGAGVAQLLALHFADRYKSTQCPLDVSAVVFAPPRVFNDYGAAQWRRTVNGRVVLDSGDGLAYMPCYDGNSKAGWARCSRGHMPLPGRGRDHYSDNYGIVEINVEYVEKKGGKTLETLMQSLFPSGTTQDEPSVLSTLFSKLVELGIPGLGRIPSLGAMGASHVCSAACKFSQTACGGDFKWWCDKCPMLL
ncbi:lipase [Gregarina niphandrodes]|uniref:Lipase n=1 Tax=Gregarina niphandrodes TaxID=110365 RepID=A0A023BA19_GRENI|nr:lipase [Gregarina niphandrodes]EZG77013.1 lipase [Gregarina niphandrodes]|eukprot:XP_011129540.1 lipase [Gregarina niphandrodes]